MRILLVNAIDIQNPINVRFPNLGLGYIASLLRQELPWVDIMIVDRAVEEAIESFTPVLVGISSVSENFNRAKSIARLCSNRGVPVVIGGVHISALPSTLTPDMHIGVIGEGEQTMLDIVQTLSKYGMNVDALQKIQGIVYRDPRDGTIISTQKREPIMPLDKLPLPARDLLGIKRGGKIHLVSSRGCPYDCIFCFSTRFWDKVRFFSAEYVVREIEAVISDYAPTHITFMDDLFIVSRKRLRQIVELIESKNINNKVSFSCSCRANLVDEEIANILARMNVTHVSMGFESGCDKTLKYLKQNVTVAHAENALRLFNRAGITVGATFIIGSPNETLNEILQTLHFIRKNNLFNFAVYPLTPLPGTPLWDYALARGIVSLEMEWSKLNCERVHRDTITLSEVLTTEELQGLWKLFEREKRRRHVLITMKRRVKKAFKRPNQIIPWLIRRVLNNKNE